jgi:SAM-dependent methyltransferase
MPHADGAEAPSPWVFRFARLVPPEGAVLDLAAGAGRHTRFFLDRGNRVTAVDRDVSRVVGLDGGPRLECIAADLEGGQPWPLGQRQFAGVVVTNYLWRPLLPLIVAAVAPGGALLYETFAVGNERFGRPRNPDFLLKPGELAGLVAGRLAIAAYEHVEVALPRPAMVQRIAALRPDPAG